MLKRFSPAKSIAKIGSKNGGFRKFKGLNISCGHWDPKRHTLGRNDVFWRIFRKNPFKGVG